MAFSAAQRPNWRIARADSPIWRSARSCRLAVIQMEQRLALLGYRTGARTPRTCLVANWCEHGRDREIWPEREVRCPQSSTGLLRLLLTLSPGSRPWSWTTTRSFASRWWRGLPPWEHAM